MGGDDDWEEFFEQCCLMFGQGTCFYDKGIPGYIWEFTSTLKRGEYALCLFFVLEKFKPRSYICKML
jgi:hypothetical protein